MGIGVGIFLIAVGAILDFAVKVSTRGFNVNTIGLILMIVGALGIALELLLFMPRRRRTTVVGGVGSTTYRTRETVVPDREIY
jgi:hypothetical protein